MKVQVVGTGSMWNKNNSACYLVDDNIMVDFPNGACKYLYRLNIVPSSVNNILITHFHGDHFFDIPFYILNKSKSVNKTINIYCSKEGVKKINKLGMLAFPNSFKSACNAVDIKYYHKDKFNIKDYEINRILVDHGRMKPAYGYIFNNGKAQIGFTGDTALCKTVEIMARVCKYLFCDCMFITGTNKHQGVDNIIYLSNKYPSCNFVVSHMEDRARKELKKLKIKNVIIPKDGDILNVNKR